MTSVFLPEFDCTVSWAMCRNPSCQNFGIHYASTSPTGEETVREDLYRYNDDTGNLRCRYCGQSFTVKSNLAIRTLARYYLELSLPFADCPKPDCSNRGYNAFEHYTPGLPISERRYRRDGQYKMKCLACGRSFHLGAALHLGDPNGLKKSLRNIIDGVRTRRSVTDAVELTGIAIGTYYNRLFRISARLRDYQAWRNARLLHQKFELLNEPIRVFTDTLQVSLQRWGEAARHQNLDIVISVVAVGSTYYILAAHPGFLPDQYCPVDDWLQPEEEPDAEPPDHLQEWDCLHHTYQEKKKLKSVDTGDNLAAVGKLGHFSISPYTELAHFLVVRKMLSRFQKVHYFMDGAPTLYSAALTALASDIRDRKAQLDKAWQEMRTRFSSRPDSKGRQLLADSSLDARTRAHLEAMVMKSAFHGGNSKRGGWAWLQYPPNNMMYKNNRILWLTWTPNKDYESLGRDLLWRATLQPVDSAFNFLRHRTYGLRRPVFRARPGRSYMDAYLNPNNATCAMPGFHRLFSAAAPAGDNIAGTATTGKRGAAGLALFSDVGRQHGPCGG